VLYRDLECLDPIALPGWKSEVCGEPSVLQEPRLVLAALRGMRREDGPVADQMFKELFDADAAAASHDRIENILVLAFVPPVHRIVRTVSTIHPSLSRDDVAQHAFTVLLQRLRSPRWRARPSHFAFTLVRQLKRDLFEWAQRQSVAIREGTNLTCDYVFLADGRSFEHFATLRHFLNKCHCTGLISEAELNLLIEMKLEGGLPLDGTRQSNAERQRLKRIVAKLRRIARTKKIEKYSSTGDTNSVAQAD